MNSKNINQKLIQLINSPEIQKILDFISSERKGKTIYPKQENIFRAFKLCPPSKIKVVIFGQDPYHTVDVADGLAFSTKQSKTPPSLNNIFKELKNEYPNILIQTNDLTSWALQGVLLLNTILTVEANKPLSHQKIGWDYFIYKVIEFINQDLDGIIFLLWGSQAKSLSHLIDKTKHIILTSAHPSPYSFDRGFFNNGHFKKANEILLKRNKKPINWELRI